MEYKTRYGVIYYDDVCKDDYKNIEHYDQPQSDRPAVVLQAPAMKAFKHAEMRLQRPFVKVHPHPRQSRYFKPLLITGSIRTCELQAHLYAQDSHRYAPPNVSGHCRAICIDVDMGQDPTRLHVIHRLLMDEGWHQARPDEPWHYSYGPTV